MLDFVVWQIKKINVILLILLKSRIPIDAIKIKLLIRLIAWNINKKDYFFFNKQKTGSYFASVSHNNNHSIFNNNSAVNN